MTHKAGHKTNPHYDALPWKTKKRFDDANKSRTAPDKGTGLGTWLYNKFSGNKKEINSPNQ
tara:strand:+ start:174 stop:356 length:183 start_codon:yes stop_codon:yes gene_type:complete